MGCNEMLSQAVLVKNCLIEWPFPNWRHYWHSPRTIQNTKPNMVLTQLIIKNYFLWVTCSHWTFCNENLIIVYKIAFSSSPLRPLSFDHISSDQTITTFFIIMLKPISLFISFFMLFRILLHLSLLITLSSIILISFLVHGIKTKIACRAFHIVFQRYNSFSM